MRSLFVVCCLAVLAQVATAGPIHTVVIPAGGTALTINVGSGRLLKIFSFVHDGPTAVDASLTKNSSTALFMESLPITTPDLRHTFNVSGPATVTINPVAGTNATITFQLVDNTD